MLLPGKRSLLSPSQTQISRQIMDAFWSIFGMPIGVTLCFGPALVVWWFTKDSEPGPDDTKH
jgi:uncharacterized Tic20 family protein